jgi:hypothetical protein
MNYFKIYRDICRRAESRVTQEPTEAHHVLPKFRFGPNNRTVDLTLREHYICHLLLVKIMQKRYGTSKYTLGALKAVFVMSVHGKGRTNSRIYESFRIAYVKNLREQTRLNGGWGLSASEKSRRMTADNPMKRPEIASQVSETVKRRHAEGVFQGIYTEERNEKIRAGKLGSKNPNFGKSEAADHFHVHYTCSVCQKTTNKGNWTRWHEENCRAARS